jgi:hypothetical protein
VNTSAYSHPTMPGPPAEAETEFKRPYGGLEHDHERIAVRLDDVPTPFSRLGAPRAKVLHSDLVHPLVAEFSSEVGSTNDVRENDSECKAIRPSPFSKRGSGHDVPSTCEGAPHVAERTHSGRAHLSTLRRDPCGTTRTDLISEAAITVTVVWSDTPRRTLASAPQRGRPADEGQFSIDLFTGTATGSPSTPC